MIKFPHNICLPSSTIEEYWKRNLESLSYIGHRVESESCDIMFILVPINVENPNLIDIRLWWTKCFILFYFITLHESWHAYFSYNSMNRWVKFCLIFVYRIYTRAWSYWFVFRVYRVIQQAQEKESFIILNFVIYTTCVITNAILFL